jgi:hypothetical protein
MQFEEINGSGKAVENFHLAKKNGLEPINAVIEAVIYYDLNYFANLNWSSLRGRLLLSSPTIAVFKYIETHII